MDVQATLPYATLISTSLPTRTERDRHL